MSSKMIKADLSLLKKYLTELETTLEQAYKLRDVEAKTADSYCEFVIMLSKAIGLLVGMGQEAGFLVGDLHKISQYSGSDSSKTDDTVESLIKNIIPSKGDRNKN